MHIQTVNYQKTFNLGNYSSEKIGVEIVLNAGEDAKKALDTAKELVEEYHKENFKEVNQEPEEIVSPEKELDNTIDFINSCKTEGELREVYLMCQKNPVLKSYYDLKIATFKTKK
jgi:hypothetical protein